MQHLSQKQLVDGQAPERPSPRPAAGRSPSHPRAIGEKTPVGQWNLSVVWYMIWIFMIHDFFHSWPILIWIKYTFQQHWSFSKCISTLLRSPKCGGKGRGDPQTCCKLGSTNQPKWRMNNHQQHQAVVHSKKDFKKDKESGRLSGSNQPKCQIPKKIHVERWCSESRF